MPNPRGAVAAGGGSGLGGSAKSLLPALPLYHAKSLSVWDLNPLSLTRKAGPCSPNGFQSRTLQEAGTFSPCPEKPGRASPQWAQALLGAWPEEVLRGLHCPCTSSTTAATPSALLSPPSLLRPLYHQPPKNTALAVPALAALPFCSWPSTGSGTSPTTVLPSIDIETPLCLSSSSYKWG